MTSSFPGAGGPAAGADGHAAADLLDCYAAGTAEPVVVWSVEAHLTGCARCRSALSAYADAERLARNRSVLLVRAAIGDGGRLRRAARLSTGPEFAPTAEPKHLYRLNGRGLARQGHPDASSHHFWSISCTFCPNLATRSDAKMAALMRTQAFQSL